jgi:DNA anti-recombination protein RmuC
MLGDLRGRFERFHEHFLKVGRHLDNAQTQFQGAVRDVERFRATLQGFKVGQLEEIRDPAAERQPGDEPDPSV